MSTISNTETIDTEVKTCSKKFYLLFSVNKTAASIAPGLAIDGTARGNMAVSVTLFVILSSSSGLLSPKIMERANRNRTIPPAISNAESGMSIAVRIISPA